MEVTIQVEDPTGATARHCLARYYAELAVRFGEGFDPACSLSLTAADLTPPLGWFLVVWRDGEAVGCGALKRDGATAYLKRMWVAADARGAGLGRRLLTALEDLARQQGFTRVQLETNRVLVEAQALYRKCGYREVAPFNAEPYAHHWFAKELESDGGPLGRELRAKG